MELQCNPDFSNLQGKRNLVREIGEFEKSGVKLQCLTEERERLLVGVIGRFEKIRVREIGIPLNLVRSGLPAESREENFPESHIISPLLAKLFRSR